MAKELQRFRVSDYSRVSAESGVGRWQSDLVTVRVGEDSPWQIEMSPYTARALARKLTRAASFLDPPKKRS